MDRKGEPVTEQEIEKILRLRLQGFSFTAIDEILSRPKHSSRRAIKRGATKRQKKWQQYATDFENGMRVRQIAEKYGVTEGTVCCALDYVGLDKEVRAEYNAERPMMYRKKGKLDATVRQRSSETQAEIQNGSYDGGAGVSAG